MDKNITARQQNIDDEQEIDLLELAREIWKKIWIVAIGFIVGAVLAFCVTKFFITPQYKATSSIFVFSKDMNLGNLASIQIQNNLTGDYQYISMQRDTLEDVIDELALNMTYEQLKETVSITNPSNTHVLEISATNSNPVIAANISNSLAEKVRESISDIMNTDKPSVVQRAVVPTVKASPSTTKNTMIGALAAAVVIIGIITVKFLLDDTIKTDEDVRKYLQLDTLAQIPYIKGMEDRTKGSSGLHRQAKRSQSSRGTKTAGDRAAK